MGVPVQEVVIWFMNLSLLLLVFVFVRHEKYVPATAALFRVIAKSLYILCNIEDVWCLFSEKKTMELRNQMQSQWFAIAVQMLTNKLPVQTQFIQFIVLNTTLQFRDLFLADDAKYIVYSVSIEFVLTVIIIPLNWYLTDEKIPYMDSQFWATNIIVCFGYLVALATFEADPQLAEFIWHFMFAMAVLFVFLGKEQRRNLPCLQFESLHSNVAVELPEITVEELKSLPQQV